MNTTPRLLHIPKSTRSAGLLVRPVLCGRLASIMACTTEPYATCTKCLAESLAKPKGAAAK